VGVFPAGVVVAALGGLAIGLEREWSGHASGPGARFGGIRTLTMLGTIAGISGWLWSLGALAMGTVLLSGCVALVLVAYALAGRRDVEATTEVSALVVVAAGALAGVGYLALASAIIGVTTLALVEKTRLHALARRLDDRAMRAAARFVVMATVVLPLLPPGPYPPWGTVRPRELWVLVLFMSGLSFAAYIARKAAGARHGYLVAGALGGLISSTNVTFAFSRSSRSAPTLRVPLAYGVVAACTMLFLRVGVATAVLNLPVATAVLPYLVPPLILGALVMVTGLRLATGGTEEVRAPSNPLEFGAALQMAALFQLVLIAVEFGRRTWGTAGVLVSGAVLGITDVDALTISMARSAASAIPPALAAQGIAAGILANTLLKLGITVAVGQARFTAIAGGTLAAMAAALGLALAGA
jgi:uncharacterized membrane protein (DUF4010 family)